MTRKITVFFLILIVLSACAGFGETPVATQEGDQPIAPTATALPTGTEESPVGTGETPSAPTSAAPSRDPLAWRDWPVIPEMTAGARKIFARGQELGNDPARFSKIGDCETSAAWFLADFDAGPERYSLGEYGELQEVIAHFQGSYGRTSLAAKPGATAASLLTPLWADRDQCGSTESPLDCELRIHRPAYAFVLVGSNDVPHRDRFEENFRKVIERTIELGVVPVLATKADNLEGDDSINATIVRLAVEYDLPLWNFWLAVQPLPDRGLQPDGAHLTWASNRFDDPEKMQNAWPVRNLTALQTLDALWRSSD
jgi:hypothetical protein